MAGAVLWLSSAAMAADVINIAHMDPLSGPFALVGESDGRLLQAAIDDVNARGGVLNGVKLELVHFDDKSSAQESVLLVKQIIDSGIRASSDFNGRIVAFYDYVKAGGALAAAYDDYGHGTHVAGLIASSGALASQYLGVAPGVNLIVFKVLDSNGRLAFK